MRGFARKPHMASSPSHKVKLIRTIKIYVISGIAGRAFSTTTLLAAILNELRHSSSRVSPNYTPLLRMGY